MRDRAFFRFNKWNAQPSQFLLPVEDLAPPFVYVACGSCEPKVQAITFPMWDLYCVLVVGWIMRTVG